MGMAELKYRLARHTTLAELCWYIERRQFRLDSIAEQAFDPSKPVESNVRKMADEYFERLLESCREHFDKTSNRAIEPLPLVRDSYHLYNFRKIGDGVGAFEADRQVGLFGELIVVENPEVCAVVEMRVGESGHNASKYFDKIPERLDLLERITGLPCGWVVISLSSPRPGKERHLESFRRKNGYVAVLPYSHGDFMRAAEKVHSSKSAEKPGDSAQKPEEKEMTPLPYLKTDVVHGDDVKKC